MDILVFVVMIAVSSGMEASLLLWRVAFVSRAYDRTGRCWPRPMGRLTSTSCTGGGI